MAAATGDDEVARVKRLTAMRHREWLSHHERRQHHRRRWEEFFAEWDVILMPVQPVPAIPHDHSQPFGGRTIDVDGAERPYTDLLRWVGIPGEAYLPSTVVPSG